MREVGRLKNYHYLQLSVHYPNILSNIFILYYFILKQHVHQDQLIFSIKADLSHRIKGDLKVKVIKIKKREKYIKIKI